ncbi:MAG: HAMP domain-containing histidine kinase [Bacteroidales bacterium]|nr:HAMP domain-containing histidine kinase [Bacteroidales bacterium]MBN2819778.1 HAMP domain-containing histidine kinase [Bacteroidales bacterium]
MGRVKTKEKTTEYYEIISKETQRLTGMVNKILNFSKLESGKRKLKFIDCNLNKIAEEVLETYKFHLKNKNFEYKFSPANTLPGITCDNESIADALVNLLDNAIKYSGDTKLIEIKTGADKKYSWIEVKDLGIGILKKHQKLIFDKFYRVTQGNLSGKAKGTGLGLSIVKEIVDSHKGKIFLESKVGEGSTFRLYFPINKI